MLRPNEDLAVSPEPSAGRLLKPSGSEGGSHLVHVGIVDVDLAYAIAGGIDLFVGMHADDAPTASQDRPIQRDMVLAHQEISRVNNRIELRGIVYHVGTCPVSAALNLIADGVAVGAGGMRRPGVQRVGELVGLPAL